VNGLWATKSEGVGLIVRATTLQDFQPMWSGSTYVSDRHTDGQTTCNRKTALTLHTLHEAQLYTSKNLQQHRAVLFATARLSCITWDTCMQQRWLRRRWWWRRCRLPHWTLSRLSLFLYSVQYNSPRHLAS